MQVHVNEIPHDGLCLEQNKEAAVLDLERDGIKFKQPLFIQAELIREFDNVKIHLQIKSRVTFCCSRCLQDYEEDVDKQVDIIKPVKSEKVIDLIQIAREEINNLY